LNEKGLLVQGLVNGVIDDTVIQELEKEGFLRELYPEGLKR
jgi:hypothetical protein